MSKKICSHKLEPVAVCGTPEGSLLYMGFNLSFWHACVQRTVQMTEAVLAARLARAQQLAISTRLQLNTLT